MHNTKRLLTAAVIALGALAGVSAANAAPWDHGRHAPAPVLRHEIMRHDMRVMEHRALVRHAVVFDTLRFHHYRAVGAPVFVHGHYVVRSFGRLGRVVFVEVNPYTGAFLGEIRI